MNFLEICQAVLGEADRDPAELVNVTAPVTEQQRKVVLWVQQSYRRIQRHSNYWKFHYNTGLFLTTTDGVEDYQKSDVRDIQHPSLKIRRQGSTGWSPVTFMYYEQWVKAFNLVIGAKGRPVFFVPLPSQQGDRYRLYPVANAVYELFADWYSVNDELQANGDEPIWHEDFHELLVWDALDKYRSEYEVGDLLGARIQRELPQLLSGFYRKYLPQVTGAKALA